MTEREKVINDFAQKLLENTENLDDEILEALETTFWDLI